jgi:hypothetical protein
MKILSYAHSKAIATQRFIEKLRYGSLDVFKFRAQYGNDLIAQMIESVTPAAIGKFGSVELEALRAYLRLRNSNNRNESTSYYRKFLHNNAGVYPDNYDIFEQWAKFWINDVLPDITIIGTWFNFNESYIIRKFVPNAKPIHSYGLEPYIFNNPWSQKLEGKKVVVVSPFPDTIEKQYQIKEKIWLLKPQVLPDFELITIKSPTHPHLVKPLHQNWFESLNDMKKQISAYDFDVLLVGAGAYSLPLCAYVKSLGKIGIHLGGNTQLVFGIMGKRWLVPNSSIDHKYFNDAWIYPLKEETPEGNTKIEGGCYW